MLWHPVASDDGTVGVRAEQADATITIGPVFRPWQDFVTETRWSLARTDERRGGASSVTCTVLGYAHEDNGLAKFLCSAAEDFRGWKGVREWSALENVELVATNSGRGRIEFVLTLRETADPDSAVVSQSFEVEAGESLTRLAQLVDALFEEESNG
jgi:hypothetical protein